MPCLLTAIQLSLLSTNLISHEFILDIYIYCMWRVKSQLEKGGRGQAWVSGYILVWANF